MRGLGIAVPGCGSAVGVFGVFCDPSGWLVL